MMMSSSNSSLVRLFAWFLLVALIGVYVLYDWYSGQLKTQIAEMETGIAETVAQVKEREQRILPIQNEVAQLKGRIDELNDQHAREKQDLADRIAASEQANAEIKAAMETLRQTDAGELAAEQAKSAALVAERDRSIAAFEAMEGQYEAALAKAEGLRNELEGLKQVIADSTLEHREQIEALERHLNERVKLAKATPKDAELMRAAQAAGLLPEAVGADEDAAALAEELTEQLAAARAELDAMKAQSDAAREEQASQLAALEEELSEARATLAGQAEQAESPNVVTAMQERLAQAEAELATAKEAAAAAMEEVKTESAAQLAEAQAQIADLTEQLRQTVAPDAVSALQERLDAAENALALADSEAAAALARAQADMAQQIEEGESKIAALTEQLASEQAAKAKVAEEIEGLVAELGAAREAADQAGTQALDEARTRIAALEATIAEERSKTEGLESALRGEAEQAIDTMRGLYRRFSALGGVHTDRGMLLKLADTELRFETAKATLTNSDLPSLDRLAGLLAEHPGLSVRIEGYTDSLGDEQTNLALSRDRAEAVKQALVERGVAAGRLSAEGMGPARPIADNETAAGRAQNRRVEVYVVED
jgi:chemotaxis protein MotB